MKPQSNPIQDILALHAAGRFADMEKRARLALKANPGFALLEELLGIALTAQKRHSDALPHLEKAVRREPADAQFWENLGLCQREIERFAEAEQSLRRALGLRPNSPEALNALGSVLRSLDRTEEARQSFEKAIGLRPDHVSARFNLAKVLLDLQQFADAERHLTQVTGALPDLAEAHLLLGRAIWKQADGARAEPSLRRAVALNPKYLEGWILLASVCYEQMRSEDIAEACEKALQLLGGDNVVPSSTNLADLDILATLLIGCQQFGRAAHLLAKIYQFAPTPERAISGFFAARFVCDWDLADVFEDAALAGSHEAGTGNVFSFIVSSKATAADQLARCRSIAAEIAASTPVLPVRQRPARNAGRLRLGYFSGDFRDHAIAHVIAGVIEAHDRGQFEIVAYDFSPPTESDYRRRLEAAFDRMVDVRELPADAAARRIADDEVDILIDLVGWTHGYRPKVVAARPAPLQIYWLGVASTTGAPWIDYNIGDKVAVPDHLVRHFSEKLIRLPDSFMPMDRAKPIGQTLSRQTYGLPDAGVVFCSFNASFKLTREMVDVWMRLLAAVPDSILWLARQPLEVMPSIMQRAVNAGVDPARIVLAPRLPEMADHLARVRQADIALDTFPYGSHSTAGDMLLAGVPLVALLGETFASRVSASVLTAAGLPNLVTTSLADYYDLALRLACDREALSALRSRVARSVSTAAFFDTERFTRNLEKGLMQAWQRHAAGLQPESFDVT